MKKEQKQHLVDIMKSDEELGLYEESKQECMITKIMQMDAKMAYDSLPKQERSYSERDLIKCYCGHTTTCDCGKEEPKQETLEEAAKRYDKNYDIRNSFIAGYKLAQERSYSEEDMLKSFIAGINCESNNGKNFEQFIEQFKKK